MSGYGAGVYAAGLYGCDWGFSYTETPGFTYGEDPEFTYDEDPDFTYRGVDE